MQNQTEWPLKPPVCRKNEANRLRNAEVREITFLLQWKKSSAICCVLNCRRKLICRKLNCRMLCIDWIVVKLKSRLNWFVAKLNCRQPYCRHGIVVTELSHTELSYFRKKDIDTQHIRTTDYVTVEWWFHNNKKGFRSKIEIAMHQQCIA